VFISHCKTVWAESRHQISLTTNYILSFQVVSVSRTPGHTKHFQTIYLTSNVRLCDCPGLVFPSKVPKTLQVHKYVCILKNDFKHQGLIKCNASFPSDSSFCMLWLARKINWRTVLSIISACTDAVISSKCWSLMMIIVGIKNDFVQNLQQVCL